MHELSIPLTILTCFPLLLSLPLSSFTITYHVFFISSPFISSPSLCYILFLSFHSNYRGMGQTVHLTLPFTYRIHGYLSSIFISYRSSFSLLSLSGNHSKHALKLMMSYAISISIPFHHHILVSYQSFLILVVHIQQH